MSKEFEEWHKETTGSSVDWAGANCFNYSVEFVRSVWDAAESRGIAKGEAALKRALEHVRKWKHGETFAESIESDIAALHGLHDGIMLDYDKGFDAGMMKAAKIALNRYKVDPMRCEGTCEDIYDAILSAAAPQEIAGEGCR